MRGLPLFLALLAVSSVSASPTPSKHQINTLYVNMNKRYVLRDIKGVATFMQPNYLYTRLDGTTLRREEFLGNALRMLKPLSNVKVTDTVDSIEMDHGHAKVTMHEVFMANQKDQDGHTHAVKQMLKVLDIWLPAGKSWQLSHTTLLKVTSYFDGKPGDGRRHKPQPIARTVH